MKCSIIICVLLQVLQLHLVASAKILGVFTIPGYSHMIVFAPIINELARRGHEITIITTTPFTVDAGNNFTIIDLSAEMNSMIKNRTDLFTIYPPTEHRLQDGLKGYELMNTVVYKSEKLRDFISQKYQFDLVIIELYVLTPVFREIFKAPTIAICNTNLMSLYHHGFGNGNHMTAHWLDDLGKPVTFMDRLQTMLYKFTEQYIVAPYLQNILDAEIQSYFPEVKKGIQELILELDLVFYAGLSEIHPARAHMQHIIPIAPTHINESAQLSQDIQSYMDKSQRGVIFVSFGSQILLHKLPLDRQTVFFEGFRRLPFDFLLIGEITEIDLKNIPKNVKITKWANQQAVLKHPNLKAFISHAGFQSMVEAIYYAVPIIAFPIRFDQKPNANMLVQLGLAARLDIVHFKATDFESAVLEVISEPKFKRNVKQLSRRVRAHPMKGVDLVVWWAEYLLEHGDVDHLHCPSMDLPFYQYYYLDIFVFNLIIVSLLTFLIRKCIRCNL